jgi:hypothetical protein
MSIAIDSIIPSHIQVSTGNEYANYLVTPGASWRFVAHLVGHLLWVPASGIMFWNGLLTKEPVLLTVTVVAGLALIGIGIYRARVLIEDATRGMLSFTVTPSILIVRMNGWLGPRSVCWNRDELERIGPPGLTVRTKSGERTPLSGNLLLTAEETNWLATELRRALDLHEPPKRLQLP